MNNMLRSVLGHISKVTTKPNGDGFIDQLITTFLAQYIAITKYYLFVIPSKLTFDVIHKSKMGFEHQKSWYSVTMKIHTF